MTPRAVDVAGDKVTFTISPRKGTFAGMPASRELAARFHLEKAPGAATCDGKAIEGTWDASSRVFAVELGRVGPKGVSLAFQR